MKKQNTRLFKCPAALTGEARREWARMVKAISSTPTPTASAR